jgi:hypothetical protein
MSDTPTPAQVVSEKALEAALREYPQGMHVSHEDCMRAAVEAVIDAIRPEGEAVADDEAEAELEEALRQPPHVASALARHYQSKADLSPEGSSWRRRYQQAADEHRAWATPPAPAQVETASLPAPGGVVGVKIKPLEWEHSTGHLPHQEVWSSGDPWIFWIVKNGDAPYVWCENLGFADMVPASPVRGSFDTLDEAKAAAQADYESRIRAALATDASPSGESAAEKREAALRSGYDKIAGHIHEIDRIIKRGALDAKERRHDD